MVGQIVVEMKEDAPPVNETKELDEKTTKVIMKAKRIMKVCFYFFKL